LREAWRSPPSSETSVARASGAMRRFESQQFVVDQPGKVALAIRITADRDRRLGALASLAQRRFGPQFAGLDHDATILQRAVRQGVDAAGKTAGAGADPDRAAAAEQRDRHRLIDKPRWLGRKFVAVQPHQRKRIVGIIDGGRQQRVFLRGRRLE